MAYLHRDEEQRVAWVCRRSRLIGVASDDALNWSAETTTSKLRVARSHSAVFTTATVDRTGLDWQCSQATSSSSSAAYISPDQGGAGRRTTLCNRSQTPVAIDRRLTQTDQASRWSRGRRDGMRPAGAAGRADNEMRACWATRRLRLLASLRSVFLLPPLLLRPLNYDGDGSRYHA